MGPKEKGNKSLGPSNQGPGRYSLLAQTVEEEEAFDYVKYREGVRNSGIIGSIANTVKGALGAGILSGHVAYMKIGVGVAIPLNFLFGIYMCYCLHILVQSAQTLYKRTRVPSMTYSDIGEAAFSCFPNARVRKWSWKFRVLMDVLLCGDLFGACATYQIIIAKSIKQLVEDTRETSVNGLVEGYPGLRVYIAAMVIPIILICLIRHLDILAPFSIIANFVIVFCIATAVYYAFQINPKFENLVTYTQFYSLFEFLGMNVFSMSCAGVAVPVENNMKNPKRFPLVLVTGMCIVVSATFLVSFFGYVGYLDKCEVPITVNFPMTTLPKILKVCIVLMIYVTHALNFWVPFNISFSYLKKYHKKDSLLKWEYIYRTLFVCLVSLVAIIFPNADNLIGFIGAVCLSNMTFIWPNIISLLVIWERPGLGRFYWRLWKHLFLLSIGCFLLCCGSLVNGYELFKSVGEGTAKQHL